MINKVSFAVPNYSANRVGFKGSQTPNKNKFPKTHEAWQLAEKKEVKDAIALTVEKKPDLKKVDDVTHDLNMECYQVSEKDKKALKQALNAQDEWQIDIENGSREILQYYMEQTSKGEEV